MSNLPRIRIREIRHYGAPIVLIVGAILILVVCINPLPDTPVLFFIAMAICYLITAIGIHKRSSWGSILGIGSPGVIVAAFLWHLFQGYGGIGEVVVESFLFIILGIATIALSMWSRGGILAEEKYFTCFRALSKLEELRSLDQIDDHTYRRLCGLYQEKNRDACSA